MTNLDATLQSEIQALHNHVQTLQKAIETDRQMLFNIGLFRKAYQNLLPSTDTHTSYYTAQDPSFDDPQAIEDRLIRNRQFIARLKNQIELLEMFSQQLALPETQAWVDQWQAYCAKL